MGSRAHGERITTVPRGRRARTEGRGTLWVPSARQTVARFCPPFSRETDYEELSADPATAVVGVAAQCIPPKRSLTRP